MKFYELGTVILVALGFMALLTVGSTIVGKNQELCAATGGSWDANAGPSGNVCPGGAWGNLFKTKPEPTKK
jgi:hypothetical protein